jgi:hypothetical protein
MLHERVGFTTMDIAFMFTVRCAQNGQYVQTPPNPFVT